MYPTEAHYEFKDWSVVFTDLLVDLQQPFRRNHRVQNGIYSKNERVHTIRIDKIMT